MRLSAIVPATDAPATLDECLRGIRNADEPPEEIIVIERAASSGPAAARNEGATRATGDVLVFVDADVVAATDAFARIRRAFDSDESLSALFGAYDAEPSASGCVSQFRNLLHHYIHSSNAGPATTFWAGLGAIRQEAFVASGGFDVDRYPEASIEDIELGLRLHEAGRRVVLDPGVQGKHLKRWTLGEMVHSDFALRGVPWARLVIERGRSSAALNLGWRHRVSAATAVVSFACACSGRHRTAAVALGALVWLNSDFYRLLLRRQGPVGAAGGVALHVVHHVTGVAAAGTAFADVAARRLTEGSA